MLSLITIYSVVGPVEPKVRTPFGKFKTQFEYKTTYNTYFSCWCIWNCLGTNLKLNPFINFTLIVGPWKRKSGHPSPQTEPKHTKSP